MFWFIGKRLLLFIPVLFGVVLIVFTINHFTPSDPVYSIMGVNITQEQYDVKYEQLGLNDPFFVQFFNYVKNLITKFDMGTSYSNKRPVAEQILERAPATLKLGLIGIAITIIIGIPCGIISATKQYSALDYSVTTLSLIFASMPNFWLALMMIIVFSLNLKWLPATGIGTWKHWILPCLTIGIGPVASVTRITRSSMLEVIRQDYVRTARAKGLTERDIIWKHALKNALIPVITVVGYMASMIMGGSVVIEAIFSFPGLGNLMMTAITSADYPLVLGSVLFVSVFVCVINLVVDLFYGFIDPRIKAQYTRSSVRMKKKPAVQEG